MTTVRAYAVNEPQGNFEPFEFELGALGPHEVDIAVETCGICHSDLSMLDNHWGMTQYPYVPGHEVVGTVADKGTLVNHLNIGDPVGLGWHAGYCLTCPACVRGDHNMCMQASATIVGRHGGFADTVRAQSTCVFPLPQGVARAEAGPLFCGGVTVFNPMMQFHISPTAHVGVIGIGGLGHLAIKFARAWGCHVTAFTSTGAKRDEALAMGAHDTANSLDADELKGLESRFDLLLSTVNVKLDWNSYIETLKPRGRLHMLGASLDPMDIAAMPLLFGQKSVSGSPVGSPSTVATMLDFCSRHDIAPITEHFPMSKLNDAIAHLRSGKARYRIVLDRD